MGARRVGRGRIGRRASALAAVGGLLALSACRPEAPFFPEVRRIGYQVSGGWSPVVGDFDHNGTDDVLWYDGDRREQLWLGHGDAAFTKVAAPADLGPGHRPVVGDFGGDHASDVVWYAGGGAPSPVWIMQQGGGIAETLSVTLPEADTVELVRDSASRDGLVLWNRFADGPSPQGTTTAWDADTWDATTPVLAGTGEPTWVTVGDLDGDGDGDLFVLDHPRARVARGDGAGGYQVVRTRDVNGPYTPVAMHLDHDPRADVVFTSYSVGRQLPTPVWFGRTDGTFRRESLPANKSRGVPQVHGDTSFARADTLVTYGNHGLWAWWMDAEGTVHQQPGQPDGTSVGAAHVFVPLIGEFNGGGAEDVLLYDDYDDDPYPDPEWLLLTHPYQD